MNILIADTFPQAQQDALRAAGHSITSDPSLSGDALVGALRGIDALIVRSTKVNADALDAADSLKLVIRAGAGTNTIDKAHAAECGVRVCNVPGANAFAVAELVFGLLLAIDRHLADNITDLRGGRWRKKQYGKARGLCGQRIGILGFGAIGAAVAARARAFGMEVCIVQSKRGDEAAKQIKSLGIVELSSRDELLGACDIVSLHLPMTAQTENLVNDDFLAKMKQGAVLVNTSRGELVDEAALLRALDARGIRAALDVYRNEPSVGEGEFASKLAQHPNVYGTHHIGASTEQAQNAVADGVVRVLESFEQGALLHCVND